MLLGLDRKEAIDEMVGKNVVRVKAPAEGDEVCGREALGEPGSDGSESRGVFGRLNLGPVFVGAKQAPKTLAAQLLVRLEGSSDLRTKSKILLRFGQVHDDANPREELVTALPVRW